MNTLLKPPCDKAASVPTQGQTDPSHRILFVDDSITVREASAKVLICCGYHVDVAEDGEAGWQALHATNYDLLITDHNMPKLSGVELVKKLRAARMNLPVVLASAALPTEELNQNPWLQLAAILSKPFTIDELLKTVKAALSPTGMTASAQNSASPVLAEAVVPVSHWPAVEDGRLGVWPTGRERMRGALMQEFREQTLRRNIGSAMHSDKANGNGVPGGFGWAGNSRLPRVFSGLTPTVSIRSQKGLVVMIGFILFLSCLWVFNRPN